MFLVRFFVFLQLQLCRRLFPQNLSSTNQFNLIEVKTIIATPPRGCEATTTVASNGNAYGIEQNCVYGPLEKISAVA